MFNIFRYLYTLFIVLFFYFPETRNEEPMNLSLLLQIPNAWSTPIGLKWSQLLSDVKCCRAKKISVVDAYSNYGSCDHLVQPSSNQACDINDVNTSDRTNITIHSS